MCILPGMNRLIEFIGNHYVLVILFVALLVMIIFEEKKKGSRGIPAVTSADAINIINHDHALVIDVRPAAEFAKGHLIGAQNIPSSEIANSLTKLNKHKNKPIILVCANGQQSPSAGLTLKKNGFSKVNILQGGISGWQRAGLPLDK